MPELVFTAGGKLLTLLAAVSPRLTDALMGLYHAKLVRETSTNPPG